MAFDTQLCYTRTSILYSKIKTQLLLQREYTLNLYYPDKTFMWLTSVDLGEWEPPVYLKPTNIYHNEKDGIIVSFLISLIKKDGFEFYYIGNEYDNPITLVIKNNNFEEETTKTEIKKSQNKRKTIPTGLRYDILHRDNFKCCICGRTAKEDGVKLHIDHIIPVSKGGTNDVSNLRTLCQDCNLGKSNKLE